MRLNHLHWHAIQLCLVIAALCLLYLPHALALDRTNTVFKVFQFPPDKIPRIDGEASDWNIVPESYSIGTDQLVDDSGKHPSPDPKNLDVRVKVGWVKGLNRLYFFYEAYDDYWDFSLPGLHNDTFELVVDGDLSGGPMLEKWHPAKDFLNTNTAYFSFRGVHAQNYHIFTPAEGKDWCMVYGAAQWIKELPWANASCKYSFKPGEAGKLVLEFWITPFDYAGFEGPQRSVESVLEEKKIFGMSWAVIDYDDAHSGTTNNGFWNLSRKHTMYGNASELVAFKLMPLEAQFKKTIEAQWTFKVADMERRMVVFKDQSVGDVKSWKWDFGDGENSLEQNPVHFYKDPGNQYVVTLWVEGPAGKSRHSKVWDVALK